MKFESQLKSGLFAALFSLASIAAIAESQPPSQTLEEIKQSLIYQGMNEKGYFRSVGFIKSGRSGKRIHCLCIEVFSRKFTE